MTIISAVLHCLQTEALALVAARGMSGVPKRSCTHRGVMELTQYAICIHVHIVCFFKIKLYNFKCYDKIPQCFPINMQGSNGSNACQAPLSPLISAPCLWRAWREPCLTLGLTAAVPQMALGRALKVLFMNCLRFGFCSAFLGETIIAYNC